MGASVVSSALHLLYADVLRPHDMAFCACRSLAIAGRTLLDGHRKFQFQEMVDTWYFRNLDSAVLSDHGFDSLSTYTSRSACSHQESELDCVSHDNVWRSYIRHWLVVWALPIWAWCGRVIGVRNVLCKYPYLGRSGFHMGQSIHLVTGSARSVAG